MKFLLVMMSLSLASTVMADTKDLSEIKYQIFQKVLTNKCANGQKLQSDTADKVVQAVMHKAIDLNIFLEAYKVSCDYNTASSISADIEFGAKRLENFKKVVGLKCDNYTDTLTIYWSNSISQAAARGFVNIDVFKKAFKISCDVDSSSSVAGIEQTGSAISEIFKSSEDLGLEINESSRKDEKEKSQEENKQEEAKAVVAASK